MRGEFTDSVRYRSSRDDISVSSVSLLDQKETCGKAVGVTRRMPTGPRLSFFLLVKSTRDPAFISSSFSPSLPLLYPEPVTAMDRADSSRLAFTAFPEYFLYSHSQPLLQSPSSDRFFSSHHTITNPLQISLLEPWTRSSSLRDATEKEER